MWAQRESTLRYLKENSHRLVYSAGVSLSAFAAGFGNAYQYSGCEQQGRVDWRVWAYAAFVALIALPKAYALPGKDLVVESNQQDTKMIASHSVGSALSAASSQPLLTDLDETDSRTVTPGAIDLELAAVSEANAKPRSRFYPAKYVFLLADHWLSFNGLCFLGNELLREGFGNSKAPLYGLALYGLYYVLIDAPFITAVDGHTVHDEIFTAGDSVTQDKLAHCFRTNAGRKLLSRTQQLSCVAGSASHGLGEVMPLLLALNQVKSLFRLYDEMPAVFWSIAAAAAVTLVVVVAQTYLYEGREQRVAYQQYYQVQPEDSKSPSRARHCLDRFLLRTLWLSVVAHAASEGLSWLLFPKQVMAPAVCFMLTAACVLNEFVGQLRSEYPEGMEETRSSIEAYRSVNGQVVALD